MGREQVDPVARRNELRKQNVSPAEAHAQAMREARKASGHDDKSKK